MDIAANRVIWALMLMLAFLVGGIVLQIVLSRRESRWPGLILPGITFLYSLVMLCSVTALDGQFPWGALLASFALGNIPTLVLLAIYGACRERLHKRSELEKMQIDDL